MPALLAAAALLLCSGFVQAQQPVIGSAGGSFSNLSSCDYSGSDRDCRIVNTSNGSATQVQWGSQHQTQDFVSPSTLTSADVSFNTVTPALGIEIGRLNWYNSATLRLNTLDGVTLSNFRYQVTDLPGGGSGSSWLGSNWWYNDEYNHSRLSVLADVTGVTSPVLEPETYALLLAGLGVIALRRRRASSSSIRPG